MPQPTVLRAAVDGDRDALAEMLSALSPSSSFQRFFTGSFRATADALDVLLGVRGTGRAFVAVEGDRIVAHAMWARAGRDAHRAEVGVIVAADRRGRGMAARLTALVLADAAERGVVEVQATVLADNHTAHGLVRRLLPHACGTSEADEVDYLAFLPVVDPAAAPVPEPRLRHGHHRTATSRETTPRSALRSRGFRASRPAGGAIAASSPARVRGRAVRPRWSGRPESRRIQP